MAEANSMERVFMRQVLTAQFPIGLAPRTVPGLQNAQAEDEDLHQLNPWQAANNKLICDFLNSDERESEGMVLCDAPGLGKTLSVLCAIVSSKAAGDGPVIIFAGKGIVAQWAEQIVRHFDPAVSGLEVYCPDSPKERHKYVEEVSPLSARADSTSSSGGVYVDERPTGQLPDQDVLRSFDVLILAKEMLSQKADSDKIKNINHVLKIKDNVRMVVIDESHNLNKQAASNQTLNLKGLSGIPKILLSGTPGTSAAEVYRMLAFVKHKSLLQPAKPCNGLLWEVVDTKAALSKRGITLAPIELSNPLLKAALERKFKPDATTLTDGEFKKCGVADLRSNHFVAVTIGSAVKYFKPRASRSGAADDGNSSFLTEPEWRPKYFVGKSDQLVQATAAELVDVLKNCFLHTPASAAPSIEKKSVERVEPLAKEVASYNTVVSCHLRDVLRAKPWLRKERPGAKPNEWLRNRRSDTWYNSKKKNDTGPTPPSGEKTIGDSMRACNGGETWSLELAQGKKRKDAPAAIQMAVDSDEDEMPQCAACAIAVPGLLLLPCGCPGEVCGECFEEFKCHLFEKKKTTGPGSKKCPIGAGCRKKQAPFEAWAKEQPRLVLETDEKRKQAEEQKASQRVQKALLQSGESTTLKKSKKLLPRPLPALRAPAMLASLSDKQIERRAKECDGAGGKLVYLAKELQELAKKGGSHVLLTPPTNKAVRSRFVSALGELIGTHALASLNVPPAQTSKALAKFRRGHALIWQCQNCGEVHEDSCVKCSGWTCKVAMDDDDANTELRYIQDVARVDANDSVIDDPIYIGSEVVVYQPGTKNEVGHGKVRALGRCNGKPGALRKAPAESCFVLVLNPQSMEGLDLPQATHLYQVEPILREDKEKQAQARGSRLGGERKLEIVQLLVAETIEEQLYKDIDEIRERKAGRGKTAQGEVQGMQAKLLNSLSLLRPEPADEQEEAADDEEEEAEEAAEWEEEVEVDAMEEEPQPPPQQQLVSSSGPSQPAEEADDRVEVLRAQRSLAGPGGVEDRMDLVDFTESGAYIGAWRRRVKRTKTFAEVANLMVELRQKMVDARADGQPVFGAGWEAGGAHYNTWLQEAQAPGLGFKELLDLMYRLIESYNEPPEPAEVKASPADLPLGRKRRRTEDGCFTQEELKTVIKKERESTAEGGASSSGAGSSGAGPDDAMKLELLKYKKMFDEKLIDEDLWREKQRKILGL